MPRPNRRRIQVSDDEDDKDSVELQQQPSRTHKRLANSPIKPRRHISDSEEDQIKAEEQEASENDSDSELDSDNTPDSVDVEIKSLKTASATSTARKTYRQINDKRNKLLHDPPSPTTPRARPNLSLAIDSTRLKNNSEQDATPEANNQSPAHDTTPSMADISQNASFLSDPNALSTPIGAPEGQSTPSGQNKVNNILPDDTDTPLQQKEDTHSHPVTPVQASHKRRSASPLESAGSPDSSQLSSAPPTSGQSHNTDPSTAATSNPSASTLSEDVPKLNPPAEKGVPSTPERGSATLEADFNQRLTVSRGNMASISAFRPPFNSVPTLVPISPSKSRLRAMEAEKQAFQSSIPTKPRLVISRLLLHNFKSYAGTQEIGPFDTSFSAVVGPNGSGKSNVIDSLLFVFGFRASKMRQGKVSGLIHSSQSHPNLDSCKVEIHFKDVIDNEEGVAEDVPDSTLVVARMAFKNNSSRYFINGRDSTYTEVTTLMRQRGIDLDHKRFLILQGEVESIAQMKPKAENENDDGLLEYLEDIIGTSEYKKSIEDAENQLESLNEECTSKLSRLEIVRKEVRSLQGPKNEVIRNMRMENELTMKKSLLYQVNIHRVQASIRINTEALEKHKAQLDADREETKEIREEIVHLEETVKADTSELASLRKEHQRRTKHLSKKEIQKVQVEERAKHLTAKQKKLEKQITTAQHAFNEVDDWIRNYEEQVESIKSRGQQLEKDLELKKNEYDTVQEGLKGKTEGITAEIEKIQQELAPWRDKISAKEAEIAIAQSEIDLITEKHSKAKESLKRAKHHVAMIVKDGETKEAAVVELQQNITHVTEQIIKGTVECAEATKKLAKMKEELDEFRVRYQVAKESVSSAKSQGAVLTSLTNLSSSGRIEGFNGRLGSLGTIDQKYDTAVSTACHALDNLVVDTVEVGEECVSYLRKNNVGRAKFILLDKLPKRNLEKINTPENVPRLFDLITPKEPRFAPAFYSVLFDTLVAKDVEQARRIAYGSRRFRVVTLDGIVIDTSGTMSGGGRPSQGRMKPQLESTVSAHELKQLEEEFTERETRYSKADSVLHKMNMALRDFQRQKPQIELEISKTKLDIESLKTTFKEAENEYVEMKKNIATTTPSAEELQEVGDKRAKLQAELEELQHGSAGLEKQIANLREKIMEIGGVRLRFLKSEIDDIKGEMEAISSRLSSQVLERTKKENEHRKHRRVIDSAQQEIEESRNEVVASEQELQRYLSEVAEMEGEIEATRVAVIEKEDALSELQTVTKEKRELVDKTLSAEIELVNTIEQHEKTLRQYNRVLKTNIDDCKGLKLHKIATIPNVNISDDQDEEMFDKIEREEEDHVELIEHTPDELSDINPLAVEQEVKDLEESLKNVAINLNVLNDYVRRAEEFISRRNEMNESVQQRDDKKSLCESLRKKRLDEFLDGFNLISLKLKEMYQMITMGGNAELELVDSLDPFSEGILFSVMPPKKSWKNISNLSGGEKTLSSLALVFALHHYKPTPLYVMDEIDAALDFRNVSIVANYIKERTKNGQFIVISLRNNMFELASQLVGIYKVNNMTKSVAIQNNDHSQENLRPQFSQHRRSTVTGSQLGLSSQFDHRRSMQLTMSQPEPRWPSVLSSVSTNTQSTLSPEPVLREQKEATPDPIEPDADGDVEMSLDEPTDDPEISSEQP